MKTKISKFTLILDSTQITAFLECPQMWDYQYRERLLPNDARQNTPMDMGTYGHKLLEIIYKERAKGNGNDALAKAFEYDIDKKTCRCSHGCEKHLERTTGTHEIDMEVELHAGPCTSIGCNCNKFNSIEFPLEKPDREFVKNRVMEYVFVEGTVIPMLIPKSPEHVEVGFSYNLYEDEKRLYVLEGRIDLLGQIASNCENGWADHKFQSRERDLYLKSIQFRNYSLVTQLPFGVVNYIRFAKKIEKDKTFKRSIISFSRLEIDSWRSELIRIFNQIEFYLRTNQTYGSEGRNWGSCSGKFGYPCDFTKLCENWTNPGLIQLLKKAEYSEKPEWRPW